MTKDELVLQIKYGTPDKRLLDLVSVCVIKNAFDGSLIFLKNRMESGDHETNLTEGDFVVCDEYVGLKDICDKFKGRKVLLDPKVLTIRGRVALNQLSEILYEENQLQIETNPQWQAKNPNGISNNDGLTIPEIIKFLQEFEETRETNSVETHIKMGIQCTKAKHICFRKGRIFIQ